MITLREDVLMACDKFLDKLQSEGITEMTTKSQLITRALVNYFEDMAFVNESLMKGDKKNEN